MPNRNAKERAFQRIFRQKIKVNLKEAQQSRLRAGAGNHPVTHNRNQIIAMSASEARKIVNKKFKKGA
jgi:hypothetical protein